MAKYIRLSKIALEKLVGPRIGYLVPYSGGKEVDTGVEVLEVVV